MKSAQEAHAASKRNYEKFVSTQFAQILAKIEFAISDGHYQASFPTINPENRKKLIDLGYKVDLIGEITW